VDVILIVVVMSASVAKVFAVVGRAIVEIGDVTSVIVVVRPPSGPSLNASALWNSNPRESIFMEGMSWFEFKWL